MGDQNRAKDSIDNSTITERLFVLDPGWQKRLDDEGIATQQASIRWRNNSGEPKLSTLRKIADLYGCKIGYLLGDEEQQERGFETLLKYFGILDETCDVYVSYFQDYVTMTVNADYGNPAFTAIKEYIESVRAIKALPLDDDMKSSLIESVRQKLAATLPLPMEEAKDGKHTEKE